MTSSWENPVLQRELRARMRGAKAFWLLFGFVGILALILSVSYWQWWRNADDYAESTFTIGRQFYFTLFGVLAALVCLITPALTSGALSLEREMHTYEALEVSLLSRRTIVVGKLGSAVAFVGLLLSASLPLTATSFLLGGVSPSEVMGAYILLLASAFVYGALGLALSSFVKTTVGATLLTYVSAAALFAVTLMLSLGGASNAFSSTPIPGRACLVALNPIGAMVGATISEGYFNVQVPAWLTSLIVNSLLGTIFTLVAVHRLGLPKADRSPLLRGLTTGLTLLLTLLLSGSFIGNNLLGDSGGDGSTTVGVALCGAGALLTMLFATGNSSRGSFVALKRGEAPSGFTYSLLTIAVGCAIFAISRLTLSLHGSLFDHRCWSPILVAQAATFGLGGIGLGASAVTRNRWVAMGIVGALAVILFALPIVEYSTSSNQTLDRILFLSAPAGISDAVNDGGAFRAATKLVTYPNSSHTYLNTFWEATAGFYFLLGVIGLAVRKAALRRA
ncbi:MAG: ABC transporter permease [Armatimonas sp.]